MSSPSRGVRGDLLTSSVACALGIEKLFLKWRNPELAVSRLGMGPRRCYQAAIAMKSQLEHTAPVVIAGVAGAACPSMTPGDLVVAHSVISDIGTFRLNDAGRLRDILTDNGVPARLGVVASASRIARGPARHQWSQRGALVVDTESAWVLKALSTNRPVAVVRCVSDIVDQDVRHLAAYGVKALRRLNATGPSLQTWMLSVAPQARCN